MLLDISGNTFSSFGNTAPTVIYTPPQLFGTGLTIWYDFNDNSTLFTNTGATTNVSTTNDIIRYIKNKGNNSNYDLISSYPTTTSLTTTNAVLPFKPNDLNTNKNSNYVSFSGIVSNSGFGPLASISANTTTTSAFTFSSAFRTFGTTGGLLTIIGGFQSNKGVTIINSNGSTVTFTILWTSTLNTAISPIPIASGERYHAFTFTVDSNNNYNLIFNNLKYTGTTGTNIYPINPNTTGTNGKFYLGYYQGLSQTQKTNVNSEYLEIAVSYNTILTDDQIYKLHQYYRSKYNLR